MSKKLKKLVEKYLFHLVIIFILANSTIALLIFSKAQSDPCMTQSEIDSDARCLYVYHNEVYEKGTRSRPHQRVDCGQNVDSTIPNLHFSGGTFNRFKETKVASFCTGNQPTQTPTQAPTALPTATATANPTQTPTQPPVNNPTVTPTATATNNTSQPTNPPTTNSGVPTSTAGPVKTATPTSKPAENGNVVSTSSTPNPTQLAEGSTVSYSGNSFGEILGKPSGGKATKTPIADTKKDFDLTSITKPAAYISILSVIGSFLLILIF